MFQEESCILSWCFSDFLTVDSGLSEARVTILFTSVFHRTRRVVSLPSQALRVSVHTPLLLLALVSELLPRCSLLALMLELLTTSVFYGGSCFSSSSAASSAASSRRCLEAAYFVLLPAHRCLSSRLLYVLVFQVRWSEDSFSC